MRAEVPGVGVGTGPGVVAGTGGPVPPPTPGTSALIGEDAAWSYAYTHAGCTAGDVAYTKCELDYDGGRPKCYELEFCWGETQYEYKIDCYTGAVIKYEHERCDEKNHDHQSGSSTSSAAVLIGENAAWGYACGHAGCAVGSISYSSCELDYENDQPHCYELEFCWNGNLYEYEIDCYSGAVLKHEGEVCDNGLHGSCHGGSHHSGDHH